MKRPEITFKKGMRISNIYVGALLFATGVAGLVEMSHNLQCALIAVGMALLAYLYFCKEQKPDEKKTRPHIDKAYTVGYMVFMVSLIALAFTEFFLDADFDLMDVTGVCMGASAFIVGLAFEGMENFDDLKEKLKCGKLK